MAHSDPSADARTDLDLWRADASANAYDTDLFFRRLLERYLGPRLQSMEARLRQLAEAAGPELDALVAESNRDENLPALRRFDGFGRSVEEVVFHPSYHVVGQVFWSSGVLSLLAEPGHEVATGALAYLLDQHGEGGHACPVACTAGAIKLLQRVGSDDQCHRYLPRLLDPDYRNRLHAAQFVTEIQGGSDVGTNSCVATPDPDQSGRYRITGEKWFCSVADAGLFVVSARLEDATEGTRGLGLFLVPRLIDGRPNGFTLKRLKTKLGTRSMATGEMAFDGAQGEAIGPLDAGFKNLVGIVLDTSRVHNALAACGIMRRAFVEAQTFAGRRRAFANPILDYPAVQETLARMKLRTVAGLSTTFRVLSMSDQLAAEPDNPAVAGARRIAVMINKYWTAVSSTANARDGIEVLGGNGTIDDFSPLPRLYRDAMVVESWEGTHNTLCAQVVRDMLTRSLHRPWLDWILAEIEAIGHPQLAGPVAIAGDLHAATALKISKLLEQPDLAPARMRSVMDQMCRLTDWISMVAQAQWVLEHHGSGEILDAIELYRLTALEGVDVFDHPEMIELQRRLAAGL